MVNWDIVWLQVFNTLEDFAPILLLMFGMVLAVKVFSMIRRLFFDPVWDSEVVHLVEDEKGRLKVKEGYPYEDIPSPYDNLPSMENPQDFKPKLNLNKVTQVKKNTVSKRTNVNLKQSVPKQSGVKDRSSYAKNSSESDIMRSINYIYDEILDLDDCRSSDSSSSYDGGSSSYDYSSSSSSSDSSSWGD